VLTRRRCILRLSAVAGVTMAGQAIAEQTQQTPADTPTKATQAAVQYQDRPKNMQMCGMCKFYIPSGGQSGSGMMGGRMGPGMMGRQMGPGMMAAGSCALVEGSISPMGWCVLYRPVNS
jgi:hypothetical protein